MATIRDNVGLLVVLIILIHVAMGVFNELLTPPADVFSNQDWWEEVARQALIGLGTGGLSAIAMVAAALGIEVRGSRGSNKGKGGE